MIRPRWSLLAPSIGGSLLFGLALAGRAQSPDLRDGQELLKAGRYAEAELFFERAAVREPDSARIQYFLGVARMRLGRAEEALVPLEKARSLLKAPNPGVLFELGTAYVRTGRFDDAIETLSRGNAEAPEDGRMRLMLGYAYYKRLDAERAREEFVSVLKAEPDDPQAHFYLGLTEAALGKLDEAQREFRRALEIAPDFVDARLGLARTLSQSGHDQEAKTELEGILKSHSEGSGTALAAHNELGLIALRGQDFEEARREFEAVVKERAEDRQATYNLWLLYKRAGRNEEAEEMKKRFEASKEEPDDPRFLAPRSKPQKPR